MTLTEIVMPFVIGYLGAAVLAIVCHLVINGFFT